MSTYGVYRTRTFGEIFPTTNDFTTYYAGNAVPARLLTGADYATYQADTIYALLASEYFGAHIAMSSEDWFKLKVMQIIYEYGPQWQREMVLQDKLLKLSEDDVLLGSKAIYNHAQNPSTEPSTNTLEELTYIDDQNTTKWKKEKVRGYAEASQGLDNRITRDFLNKFKKLFIRFVYPTGPIFYEEGADES